MKIVVHDYSGHPFQIQLSRELARRGHETKHVYFKDFQTPKGPLSLQKDDPARFSVEGLSLGEPFQKYNFVKRRSQEIAYGRKLAELLRREQPDIFISSNAPLDVQHTVLAAMKRQPTRCYHWLQDIYSEAITTHFQSKYLGLGRLIAGIYTRMEGNCLKKADGVILISEDFKANALVRCLPEDKVITVRNWANTSEIQDTGKTNAWAQRHDLTDSFNFIYSGTLGLKHNPQLLVNLAAHFKSDPKVQIVVVSEGLGADWLRKQKETRQLDNLLLLPFQPYAELSSVLSCADVLVSLLEPGAGLYSVPSKTLSYLSAGRAQLMAVPLKNLAARIVSRDSQSGLASAPSDHNSFIQNAQKLFKSPDLCAEMAQNARNYAIEHFDIQKITDQFEAFLSTPETKTRS